ncbi:TonB-dependent receptor [Janthinobacterium sp. PC23-8]|uniref:TonB-dependent receptor domain-containing protein n=1 Tax=Janthinobacterium sp. PC23-8 TaxID=2012679 RepID=UPI000B95DC5C|nr:TonB-dependent receptor [Janthinobacterium sp. PC23-8]OYO26765.1 TonB-dependent receptor [Janthinobacterium sp. PC23-8]
MLAFAAPATALAQQAPTLPAVTVSASALALGSDDMSTPVTVLDGDELVRVREATLGETLAGQPGIHSSHFGAGASRPIIRGMDGPRVKVLSDGAEVQDASTISPDHAVAVEPMLAEQVEVLRGPSALAYGGGAVGGVVNVIDNKIPTRVPAKGWEGSAEVRANSGAREKAGAFEMTGGAGNVAFHAEGVRRDAKQYKVGSGWQGGSTVAGSYNDTDTGSVGAAWVGARGFLGLAFTSQRAEYGLPGHNHEFESCHPHGTQLHCGEHKAGEEHEHEQEAGAVPYVKLKSERWDVRGELRDPLPGFTRLRLRAAVTDYRHDEIEGTQIATTFRNKGHDARLEMEHVPLAGWRGVVGLQTTRRDFSALGEEAYVAPTLTRKHAAFLVEEYTLAQWRFEAALRHEWQDIDVDSATLKNHSAKGISVSLGAVWKFAPQFSLGSTVSRTHRLPSAEELYANGVHMATATYELGNQNLGKETSNNIDVTVRKYAGATTFSLGAYRNQIDNYIFGSTLDSHEGFQLIEYAQRDATFTGVEGQIRQQLNPIFGASVFGDYVRARLADGGAGNNNNLPRIPARRLGMKLDANWQNWNGVAEFYRVGKQDKVAAFETSTPGYNMLNLSASYNTRLAGTPTQFYLKANNLTNELAYSHTSFIKNAAPLTGRNLTAGVRLTF